jgi:hypothetical protein
MTLICGYNHDYFEDPVQKKSAIQNPKSAFASPIFATTNYLSMEQQKKSTTIWWIIFLASTAGLFFAIYSQWEWLTLILPFVATSFVKALRIM